MSGLGLQFEQDVPVRSVSGNRVDVACFVGCVGRAQSSGSLPASLWSFWRDSGYVDVPGAPSAADPALLTLLQLPVPVDSWDTFRRFFEYQSRPLGFGESGRAACYLAQAVRSFFAQGGRKCYVVRVADPLPLDATLEERLALLRELLPRDPAAYSTTERSGWRGMTHLLGLTEASFLCMPDLVWLFGAAPAAAEPADPQLPSNPAFVECSVNPTPEPVLSASIMRAPRYSEAQLDQWARSAREAALFLRSQRRDVQLVLALPLPESGADWERDPGSALAAHGIIEDLDNGGNALGSAFVQLTYPWFSGAATAGMPEELEPPDGAVCGILARSILALGAHAQAARQTAYNVQRLVPELARSQRESVRATRAGREFILRQKVTLLGYRFDQVQLLSDVTLSNDRAWRPASVNRLMSVWTRALSQVGRDLVFEASNEALWRRLRRRAEFVGQRLFVQGALGGANAGEAYQVLCDRRTMTQADLDNGRTVAEVRFLPAAAIEAISVSLALDESQRVSVLNEGSRA